jgi:hypothetical protein
MRSGAVWAHDQRLMRTAIRRPTFVTALLLGAALLAGCAPAAGRTVHLQLRTLNDSGVTGNVTLTAIDEQRTRVEIEVDPAGHLSMPAHIHPGTCDALIPQPKYPLQNVVNGGSVSEVPAPLDELLDGGVAVNLHKSNEEMQVYTACVELG